MIAYRSIETGGRTVAHESIPSLVANAVVETMSNVALIRHWRTNGRDNRGTRYHSRHAAATTNTTTTTASWSCCRSSACAHAEHNITSRVIRQIHCLSVDLDVLHATNVAVLEHARVEVGRQVTRRTREERVARRVIPMQTAENDRTDQVETLDVARAARWLKS